MKGEILFSGTLKAEREHSGRKEFRCELERKHSSIELRMHDQADIFNILVSKVEEHEYSHMKDVQGIRVDYYTFVRKMAEMLGKVQREELSLSVTDTKAVIVERGDFKNIVQIELPLSTMGDVQFKRYVADVVRELQVQNAQSTRENAALREERERSEKMYRREKQSLEEEAAVLRKKYQEVSSEHQEKEGVLETLQQKARRMEEGMHKYQSMYEQASKELGEYTEKIAHVKDIEARKREKERECALLKEDLAKANEIIKRNFEEIKAKKKAEHAFLEDMEEIRTEKARTESTNTQLEAELVEKKEEMKVLEEMGRERKEVIDTLKAQNRILTHKLESAYRVYARLYGRSSPAALFEDDDTKTEDTASSLIAPESLNYT
ncbi:hypothetical protein NECID01_0212 [Nematocida sp. AWRm77]|nr:hypothetical protein NECID01_0212 [Nematocida sp. AWRm77]